MDAVKERFTILVVDDAPENLSIAVGLLHDAYQVKVARSGERALAIAAAPPPPDLILLDVMMPGMDGFEVCRILKSDGLLAHIPVIFLTAKTETDALIRGFSLGAADYVNKPFRGEELLARVRTHLEIKHSRDLINTKIDEQKEMLHILCHDLANPFANILGVLQVMDDDPSTIMEYAPLLRDSARNGKELIELVRLMRAVEEKPLPLEPLALSKLVAESLGMLNIRTREKSIDIRVDVPDDLMVVAERISFVNSVLNNVLTNAIKFSRPGAGIDIRARRSDGMVRLSVRDHGVGMPRELLSDIFDVRKATSRPGTSGERGTGFGMPLILKFVKAYGGGMEVNSTEEADGIADHGTEVLLALKEA